MLRPDEHSLLGEGARRLRSAGRASWGVHLRIVDQHGRVVPAGVEGEVVTASPGVMAGYWRDDEQTAAALRDGWLHTGDIGHLDADGILYVVDRKKDMIVTGGEPARDTDRRSRDVRRRTDADSAGQRPALARPGA